VGQKEFKLPYGNWLTNSGNTNSKRLAKAEEHTGKVNVSGFLPLRKGYISY
jgi:hypothetical protein